MQSFEDTFETRKRSFIRAFSICMTVTLNNLLQTITRVKSAQIQSFSGPYFPTFSLNMERYEVSLRVQSESGKIRTRKNSVFGHFSRNVVVH